MAKFPIVSGNQMIRYLQKKGFVIAHRKGSHPTLRNADRVTVVPVGNKKLRIGTQFSILLYAGIDKDLFINDFKQGIV